MGFETGQSVLRRVSRFHGSESGIFNHFATSWYFGNYSIFHILGNCSHIIAYYYYAFSVLMNMESGFELNLPDPVTPSKLAIHGDSILLSPSSVQSVGEIAGMINTGGTPIASLKTPTKVLGSQNLAPKPTMPISPRLLIKVRIEGFILFMSFMRAPCCLCTLVRYEKPGL